MLYVSWGSSLPRGDKLTMAILLTPRPRLACDNFFEYIFESDPPNECNAPCRGDPSEVGGCGGPYIASTYAKDNSTFIIPAVVLSVGSWQGLGCYKSVEDTNVSKKDAGLTRFLSAIRPVLAPFSGESTPVTLLWNPALLPAKVRNSSSLASNSGGSAVRFIIYGVLDSNVLNER
jgi:hypothetical protein